MKSTISEEAECFAQGYGSGTPQIGRRCAGGLRQVYGGRFFHLPMQIPDFRGKQHSCIFLREMASYLLNQTLADWNKNYEFHSQLVPVVGGEATEIIEPIVVGGGCPKWKDRDSSGLFPINTEAGLVENVLYLCD